MPEKIPIETPSYYAIVPADVRYSEALCMGAKLLYGEITALTNRSGFCWASNAYFAKLYAKDTNTISRWIKELAEGGFITPEISKKDGNQRKIYLSLKMPEAIHENRGTPIPKNVGTPIHKNGDHNNTILNSKLSNTTTKGETLSKEEIIKQKKKNFFELLNNWKLKKNKGKYPDQVFDKFFTYWTEVNELKGGSELRFEKQAYFEIGKRLATFWGFVSNEDRAMMWKEQESAKQVNQLDFGNILNAKNEFNQ